MQLYIQDIVVGIKRPELCKNTKLSAAVYIHLTESLMQWLSHAAKISHTLETLGAREQREQIFFRAAQMHSVRLVDNFL